MNKINNRKELIETLENELCVNIEETRFYEWLENPNNLSKFTAELNLVWVNLKEIYTLHSRMTEFKNSDSVWEEYFDIIHTKLQKINDKVDPNIDLLEFV